MSQSRTAVTYSRGPASDSHWWRTCSLTVSLTRAFSWPCFCFSTRLQTAPVEDLTCSLRPALYLFFLSSMCLSKHNMSWSRICTHKKHNMCEEQLEAILFTRSYSVSDEHTKIRWYTLRRSHCTCPSALSLSMRFCHFCLRPSFSMAQAPSAIP